MGAAAAAAKKGDKTFKFGDKEYKVTMKKSTADAIDEQSVDESLRQELAAMGAKATEIEKYAKTLPSQKFDLGNGRVPMDIPQSLESLIDDLVSKPNKTEKDYKR